MAGSFVWNLRPSGPPPQAPQALPPEAPQQPHTLTAFGHDREDPWYWLRERDDPEVRAYLEAENSYTESVLAPLDGLRSTLFEEMKARILETDMSVAARRGPWWYYGRTEEGKSYGIHCRRPAAGPHELPPAGEPGPDEQILLDENVLAEGHEYFAVGTAVVSPDHSMLAYGTDTAGDERYELRFRSLDAAAPGDRAPEMVPDTGYGLAWSSGSDVVFYVRLDESMRPYQLWRHELGTDPATDVLVFEEERPPVLARYRAHAGTGPSSSSPCTAPTPPNGWPYRPTIPPRSPASCCRARRVGSTPSTT